MSAGPLRADALPGLLCEGLPVATDWTMVFNDHEETVRVEGTIVKVLGKDEGGDMRVLWWGDHPRVGLDNRAAMFLEVDFGQPMVRDRAVRWLAEGVPGRMAPMTWRVSPVPDPQEMQTIHAWMFALARRLKEGFVSAQDHTRLLDAVFSGTP